MHGVPKVAKGAARLAGEHTSTVSALQSLAAQSGSFYTWALGNLRSSTEEVLGHQELIIQQELEGTPRGDHPEGREAENAKGREGSLRSS